MAKRENRDWLDCDINPRAWTVFKRQFSEPKPLRSPAPVQDAGRHYP